MSQDNYEQFLKGKIELCNVLLKQKLDTKTRQEGEKQKAESEKQLSEYLDYKKRKEVE